MASVSRETSDAATPPMLKHWREVKARHPATILFYRVGDFYRSFILSDEVERGKITADLNNGVLRLTLPKAERAKTRRIEIRS